MSRQILKAPAVIPIALAVAIGLAAVGRAGRGGESVPVSREERDKRIVELRRRGLTYQRIADEAGLSRGQAYHVVKHSAPELVERRKPIATAERVVELREAGAGFQEIAGQLHTSVQYVLRALRRERPELARLTLRDLGLTEEEVRENGRLGQLLERQTPVVARRMAERYLKLKELADEGLSQEAAARELGLYSGQVSKYARRYGIEFARRREGRGRSRDF